MKGEEDNPCCLALSARAPCRAALTGHSFPPGTLHVPVQPEQLHVYASGMYIYIYTYIYIYGELHSGVYTRSKKFLFQLSSSSSKNPDHTKVNACSM